MVHLDLKTWTVTADTLEELVQFWLRWSSQDTSGFSSSIQSLPKCCECGRSRPHWKLKRNLCPGCYQRGRKKRKANVQDQS